MVNLPEMYMYSQAVFCYTGAFKKNCANQTAGTSVCMKYKRWLMQNGKERVYKFVLKFWLDYV